MRLATWNTQAGVEANWDAIEELDADVLAIQEAWPGTQDFVERHDGWKCLYRAGTYYPGLAVLARRPFRLGEMELSEPFAISTVITGGPSTFRFVNFWAMTPGNVDRIPYTGQARKVIESLPDEDDVRTVVAGDFNRSKLPHHLRNVRRLNDRGLVSAYHKYQRICHTDEEREKTRYAAGPDGPAWHIDFVFVPDDWEITCVAVGKFDRYAGRGRSDHVPVIVTIGSMEASSTLTLASRQARGDCYWV